MFSAIAPTYDFLNHLLSFSIDRWWRRVTVRRTLLLLDGRSGHATPSSPTSTVRILDLATGTGDLAFAFARGMREAGQIVGVDFAAPMLQIANRKARRIGQATRVVFAQSDGHFLPFHDGAFDLASIAFGLRNTEDPAAVLREMSRVVRPGGVVAVLEFSRPTNPVFRRLFSFYFFQVLPRIGGAISGSGAYRYLPASVAGFWGMGELRRRLRVAGLRPVESLWLSGGIASLHMARRPALQILGGRAYPGTRARERRRT